MLDVPYYVHHLTFSNVGYTAGPLFWGFAENPIAIIGACLPTLAPLWSKQHRSTPKGWSYLKNLWKSFSSSSYEDLEGYYQNTNNAEHASISRLVTPGPATDIHAEDIALADMPQEGIQVLTTLSSNYKKWAVSNTILLKPRYAASSIVTPPLLWRLVQTFWVPGTIMYSYFSLVSTLWHLPLPIGCWGEQISESMVEAAGRLRQLLMILRELGEARYRVIRSSPRPEGQLF